MFADRDGNRSQRLLLLRCIAIGAVITGIIATGSSAIATVGVVTVAVSGIIATITAVATALTGILRFLGLIRRGLLGVLLGARSHGGLLLSSPGLLRAGAPRTVRSADLAVIGGVGERFVRSVGKGLLHVFGEQMHGVVAAAGPSAERRDLLRIAVGVRIPHRHRSQHGRRVADEARCVGIVCGA